MTPWAAVEDLAMVVRLAILTEDRDPDEQAALLRVARIVDDQIAPPGCSLERQAVVTWEPDEDLSGDVATVTTCPVDPRPWARTAPGLVPRWEKGET